MKTFYSIVAISLTIFFAHVCLSQAEAAPGASVWQKSGIPNAFKNLKDKLTKGPEQVEGKSNTKIRKLPAIDASVRQSPPTEFVRQSAPFPIANQSSTASSRKGNVSTSKQFGSRPKRSVVATQEGKTKESSLQASTRRFLSKFSTRPSKAIEPVKPPSSWHVTVSQPASPVLPAPPLPPTAPPVKKAVEIPASAATASISDSSNDTVVDPFARPKKPTEELAKKVPPPSDLASDLGLTPAPSDIPEDKVVPSKAPLVFKEVASSPSDKTPVVKVEVKTPTAQPVITTEPTQVAEVKTKPTLKVSAPPIVKVETKPFTTIETKPATKVQTKTVEVAETNTVPKQETIPYTKVETVPSSKTTANPGRLVVVNTFANPEQQSIPNAPPKLTVKKQVYPPKKVDSLRFAKSESKWVARTKAAPVATPVTKPPSQTPPIVEPEKVAELQERPSFNIAAPPLPYAPSGTTPDPPTGKRRRPGTLFPLDSLSSTKRPQSTPKKSASKSFLDKFAFMKPKETKDSKKSTTLPSLQRLLAPKQQRSAAVKQSPTATQTTNSVRVQESKGEDSTQVVLVAAENTEKNATPAIHIEPKQQQTGVFQKLPLTSKAKRTPRTISGQIDRVNSLSGVVSVSFADNPIVLVGTRLQVKHRNLFGSSVLGEVEVVSSQGGIAIAQAVGDIRLSEVSRGDRVEAVR